MSKYYQGDLNPCRFCGEDYDLYYGGERDCTKGLWSRWVYCAVCGASGPVAHEPIDITPGEMAAELWNNGVKHER